MPRPTLLAAAILAVPTTVVAQPPATPADPVAATVAACMAAATAERADEATRLAADAEQVLRARLARAPRDADAMTLLARALAACRIPFVPDVQKAELIGEAIELTQRAVEQRPTDWSTRYQLALMFYRMPAFLGRTSDAARQLDTLLLQQGTRADVPTFARTFEYRGVLWSRAGRPDSAAAVWRRGAALFPGDSALAARLRGVESTSTPPAPPTAAALGTVRVVERAARPPRTLLARTPAPSEVTLDRGRVMTTPGAMADVFQNVGLQPGATRVTEGSDVYTRGGSPAETPVFVDGGRMLSASKFEGLSGGLFGALDPAVLRSARYSTGAFSVRFGNALSGVLELETDARPRDRRTRLGLSTAQGAATARTPLGARAGAWGTVRVSNAGMLLRMHDRAAEFASAPWSVDALGAVVSEPRPGTTVRVVGLVERDASSRVVNAGGLEAPFRSTGDTRLVVVSGSTIAARAPLRLRGSLSVGDRLTAWDFGVLSRRAHDGSAVARVDGEWMPRETLTLRAGAEGGALLRRESGRAPTTPRLDAGAPSVALGGDAGATGNAGAYAEVETAIGSAVTLIGGVRADRLPGESVATLDPRLALAWRAGAWTARLAGGVHHQGRWRGGAAVPNPGLPAGVATEATHLVAGVERDGLVHWRVEAYHKRYGRVAPLTASAGASAMAGPDMTGATATGLDAIAQRDAGGRLTGWLGYSLLRARTTLADGRIVSSPADVTHSMTAVGTLALVRGMSLGATTRYGTGAPHTPIVGATSAATGARPVYGATLAERLPAYARVDVRLMQLIPVRTGLLTGYVEALNVLDRANVASYTYDAAYRARQPVRGFFASRTFVVGAEYQLR